MWDLTSCREYLFWHLEPLFLLPTLLIPLLFLMLFVSSFSLHLAFFALSHTHTFLEVPPSWLLGPAVGPSEPAGTSCVWYGTASDSPHRGHACNPPPPATWHGHQVLAFSRLVCSPATNNLEIDLYLFSHLSYIFCSTFLLAWQVLLWIKPVHLLLSCPQSLTHLYYSQYCAGQTLLHK